jgi:polyvinyl alcohol dehydrogenase (cytochrome)
LFPNVQKRVTPVRRHRCRRLRVLSSAVIVAVAVAGCGGSPGTPRATAGTTTPASTAATVPGPWDWPTYGHDPQHTFHGRTTLTQVTARTLRKAWLFPTGDAVTATPTVVGGTVYVGSWDGNYYAVALQTGRLRWKTQLKAQHAVTPYPGQKQRDTSSDGGLVTSSAWFEPGAGSRPPLVIFGGGYTLYALNATTGAVYWQHDYPGRTDSPPNPDADGTRIFSSPVVAHGIVVFGTSVDGARGYGGYLVGASLETGNPVWQYQTDVDAHGAVLHDGCGNVWSSGTVLPAAGLVVFGTADCAFSNTAPLSEAVLALHVEDGRLAWEFRPPRTDNKCDYDFGASANAGVSASGDATFLGEGSKDGTYYSLDPSTGQLRWATNVVFGGFAGGFMATTAFDGTGVFGATGIGDFGRFESNGPKVCNPSDPKDTPSQNPSDHAFDAHSGAVRWQVDSAASFAPTTVAGGMAFNGLALKAAVVDVRDTASGRLVVRVRLPQANWSGIATVGDALVLGLGSSYNPASSGIEVLTPGGRAPVVPATG